MKLKLDENGHAVVQDGKPVYVHEDGKEVAFDAPAAVSKISALNREAQTHREAKEAAEARVKVFDGIEDADAARKALETIKNIDEGKLIAAGKIEEIKTAAQRAAQEQVSAAAKANAESLARVELERDQARAELYAEKIGGSFTRSRLIAEKFAIPADIVQARFGQAFKVEEGRIVAYDQAGNKIFSRAKPGELADFDEALETLVDAYPYKDQILKGASASGGGASGGRKTDDGKRTITRAQFDALSPTERAKAAREATITD